MGDADEVAFIRRGEIAWSAFFGIECVHLIEFVRFAVGQEGPSETWKAFASDDDVFGFDLTFFAGALDGVGEEVDAMAVVLHIERGSELVAETVGEKDGVSGFGVVDGDDEEVFTIFGCVKDGVER